jgi:hypothetical protein
MLSVPGHSMWGDGKITQNAGTVIVRLVPPREKSYTRLTSVWYTAGTTAHTLTVMRPLGKTYASSAAAAAQAVINIEANPGTYSAYGTINTANNGIAANDYCVYQTADGNYVVDTVSSVSTLAITMATNVPTATVLKGAPFWFFGVIGDTNPNNNTVHPQYTLPASTTTYLGSDPGEAIFGFVGTIPGLEVASWPLDGMNEPMIIHSGNATAAGTIEKATAIYSGR